MRSFRTLCFGVSATLLAAAVAAPSLGLTWPMAWTAIGSCAENEAPEDENPDTVDLVGAAGLPAAFLGVDGDYLYLRERILQEPTTGGGGFANAAWVVLIQVPGGDPLKYQWLIALDGTAEEVGLWENDQATASNISFDPIFNDPAETRVFAGSAASLARTIAAGSSIGGKPNYFVDFAIPRATGRGMKATFATRGNQAGGNEDGSSEVLRFDRVAFEKSLGCVLMAMTQGAAGEDYQAPAPSLSGKFLAVEANGNPAGTNSDGNTEIFVKLVKLDSWLQITDTTVPAESRRPATVSGRRIVFDSTGDLVGTNADGNREIFIAKLKSGGGVEIM